MTTLIMLIIGLIISASYVKVKSTQLNNPLETFYAILVFISIGLGGVFFGFIPHIFFSDYIAKGIGWPTGSPFQLEVGMHDGCWGILGLLSLKYRRGFIQATVIGFSILMIMAGLNHLWGMIEQSNYAPFNFQYIAGDLVPALVFLYIAWKYGRTLADAKIATTQ